MQPQMYQAGPQVYQPQQQPVFYGQPPTLGMAEKAAYNEKM